MLVVARRKDQGIVINNNIRVVVIEVRNGVVRLGIEAPKDIPVHRDEVQEAVNREAKRTA